MKLFRKKYPYEISEKGINLIKNCVQYCCHRIMKHEDTGIDFISPETITKLKKEIEKLTP